MAKQEQIKSDKCRYTRFLYCVTDIFTSRTFSTRITKSEVYVSPIPRFLKTGRSSQTLQVNDLSGYFIEKLNESNQHMIIFS